MFNILYHIKKLDFLVDWMMLKITVFSYFYDCLFFICVSNSSCLTILAPGKPLDKYGTRVCIS